MTAAHADNVLRHLRTLAKGAPDAWLTREAGAALKRLRPSGNP
jgi:hypothetical protein